MKHLFIFALITLSIQCSDDNNTNTSKDIPIDTNYSLQKNQVYLQYNLPLPIELFEFIRNKGAFKPTVLTSIISGNGYLFDTQKAILLGIYTADLAYCSVLENGQSTNNYTAIASSISSELFMENAYGSQFVHKLEQNIDNADSLIIITTNAYYETCNYLEQSGVINVLPFVIYGGWIESLYIICNSVSNKITEDIIKQEILSVQPDIDKIITYLYDVQIETSAYKYNDELKVFIKDLEELNRLFEAYKLNQTTENYNFIEQKISTMRKKLNVS